MSRIFRDDEGAPGGDEQTSGTSGWETDGLPAPPSPPSPSIFADIPPPAPSASSSALFEEASASPPSPPGPSLFRAEEGTPIDRRASKRRSEARPRKRRKRRRSPARAYIALTSLFLVLLLVADAGYVAIGMRSSLLDTLDSFERASAQLDDGNIAGARATLEGALASSSHAAGLTKHPAAAIAGHLPSIGDDVRAVSAMARAANLAAEGSAAAADAAVALGATGEQAAGAIYQDGVIQLDLIKAAQPFAQTADRLLGEALVILAGATTPTSELVAGLLRRAGDELGPVARTIHTGNVLAQRLPEIFGSKRPRRYLLTFQALGEARGTGGLIGLVGELRFSKGVPRLSAVEPVLDVFTQPITPVQGPWWFEAAYGAHGALQQPQQANVSPNFPAVAQVFIEMYEQVTDRRIDGVIGLDAHAFGMMLEATGPVRARGLDVQVTADNAVEVLLHDSYLVFPDETAQNAYYGRLVNKFWDVVRGPFVDAPTLARQLGEAVRTQHGKLYFRQREAQLAMTDLKATGDYALYGPNTQVVFGNNYSVNKIDYFMQRALNTVVKLQPDGTAKVTTTVDLVNGAPTEPPSQLIGPGLLDDPPGMNRTLLSLLMPEGAGDATLDIDGKASHVLTHFDQRAPVAWQVLEIPAGESVKARFTYKMPQTFVPGASARFSFALAPQTTVTPDKYRLRIVPPPGMAFLSPEGVRVPVLKGRGTLEAPLQVQAEVVGA